MTAQIIQFPRRPARVLDLTVMDADLEVAMTDLMAEIAPAPAPAPAVKAFEVGKTYTCRSACDWDCVFEYTVVKRTAKRVTLRTKHGKTMVRGVSVYDGSEYCKPEGDYSMCPIIRASR